MTERETHEQDFDTSQKLYDFLLEQVFEIAKSSKGKLIFRSPEDVDEHLYIEASQSGCSFLFSTTELNIAKPDSPQGAYENTFTYTFDQNGMSLTYFEALPRREQSIRIFPQDYPDMKAFKKLIGSFFEKFNLLMKYFNLDKQVVIPGTQPN